MKKTALMVLVLVLSSGCAVIRGVRQTDQPTAAEQQWQGDPYFAPTNRVDK